MNIDDFRTLVKNYTEDNITSDEPHVGIRCAENGIDITEVKRHLLFENSKLIRLVEDRPKVYKLYYRLSRQQELKIVIDLFTFQRINIRTVKRLMHKFKIKFLQRGQRF